jgi:hypothetical protein
MRQLISLRLREIHASIGGQMSMGDLAAYVGQPMSDAMTELIEFVCTQERQRAVEICDLKLDRELCAKAIRDPNTPHPSKGGAQ